MRKTFLVLPAAALSLALLGAGGSPALAHTGMPGDEHGSPGTPGDPTGTPVLLVANLNGANEIPVPGGPAVGDPDGAATAVVRVQGTKITFALRWTRLDPPTLGHIHEGGPAANGPVKVGLFAGAMPDTVTAAAGTATVDDAALADRLRTGPSGFYVNLHTAQFPGGAVRGQLHPVTSPADLPSRAQIGRVRATLLGSNEVPVAGGPLVGDPDGRAVAALRLRRTSVDYTLAWTGVTPSLGHLHQGAAGVNGPVVVPLFGSAVPASIFAVSGTVTGVDRAVMAGIRANPAGFYANLHSAQFPGGAVRGQLH